MKRKAKELQLAKREARKEGRSHYSGGFGASSYGSHSNYGSSGAGPTVETLPSSGPSYNTSAPAPRYGLRSDSRYV